MRNEIREQIVNKLSDKEYRDIFVSEQINTGRAFQIRGLREQRGWSQSELGQRAGMAQSRISVMEDANYSRFSLNTLKRLASAFDVALTVRFDPYRKLVENFIGLDSSALEMPSFTEDVFHNETLPSETLAALNAMPITAIYFSDAEPSEFNELANADVPRPGCFYPSVGNDYGLLEQPIKDLGQNEIGISLTAKVMQQQRKWAA